MLKMGTEVGCFALKSTSFAISHANVGTSLERKVLNTVVEPKISSENLASSSSQGHWNTSSPLPNAFSFFFAPLITKKAVTSVVFGPEETESTVLSDTSWCSNTDAASVGA